MSEGQHDGPCRTETLEMRCGGFGIFHNISVKTMFFSSWWIFFKISVRFDIRYTPIFSLIFLGFSAPTAGTYDYSVIHDFIDSIYRVRHVKIIRFLTHGLT